MRTKAELIAALRADQQLWRDHAAQVRPARYAEPGPMGEWSFADMAGHLSGWRERTIARVEAAGRREPEPAAPWPSELDADDESQIAAINDWIRAHHAGRSPEQLVGDYDASYDRLIAAIDALPDAVLTDPTAAPGFGAAIADLDFTGHVHEEHLEPLREWLASR